MLDVCLLGTGGMMPLPNRWLTSLILRHNGKSMLIDCGEGTQITLKMLGWSFKSIEYICFTHYHGDHIGGLPGLLLTIGNSDRREPLTLVGPKGLKRVVEGLRVIAPDIPFELNYIEINYNASERIQLGEYDVNTYSLDHGMPCIGYSVDIHRKPKFLPEKAEKYNIPIKYWKTLQQGETVKIDEEIYTPDMVLGEKRKGIKLSYCTDTRPNKNIIESIKGSDLFICEGMYGDDEKQEKAKEYKHMTFEEAATLAKEGDVQELWLTHFSPSLVNPKEHIKNARKIFDNTKIGYDRMITTIPFEND